MTRFGDMRSDQEMPTGGAAAAWGGITGTLTDQVDLQTALNGKSGAAHTHAGVYEPANPNLQAHVASAHAPANAQKNSDITKAEIEAKLVGSIATHTHLKADVGLGSVDNTSDAAKPVSTATQTALNLKAPLASPTFTGIVAGITKAMVGLTSVDDTSDAAKPVSTATQTALNLKAPLAGPSFTAPAIADGNDLAIGTTTGSRIGQAGSKLGFFGVNPVARPTALTQTYATASAIHAAVTQLAAPAGGTGVAAGAWSTAANRDLAIASINAARVDIANVKNFVNQIANQLRTLGLLQ